MHADILPVLKSIAPESPFEQSTDFLADGLIDSFDVVMITTALEERFQVHIPGERITAEHYRSLDRLAALIAQCQERQAS